jgi:hypothetical protein
MTQPDGTEVDGSMVLEPEGAESQAVNSVRAIAEKISVSFIGMFSNILSKHLV